MTCKSIRFAPIRNLSARTAPAHVSDVIDGLRRETKLKKVPPDITRNADVQKLDGVHISRVHSSGVLLSESVTRNKGTAAGDGRLS